MFWLSLLEISMFILSLLLFFTDPVEMVYIWYHVGHCFRAFVGFTIFRKIPRPHQMAAHMSIPNDEKMPFEKIMSYLLIGAQDALKSFTTSTKKLLIVYVVMTCFQLLLDLIDFFTQVHNFGEVQSAFADLALITLSSIFLFIDWYYILWVMSLQFKFPSYFSIGLMKTCAGMIESLHQQLGEAVFSKR